MAKRHNKVVWPQPVDNASLLPGTPATPEPEVIIPPAPPISEPPTWRPVEESKPAPLEHKRERRVPQPSDE